SRAPGGRARGCPRGRARGPGPGWTRRAGPPASPGTGSRCRSSQVEQPFRRIDHDPAIRHADLHDDLGHRGDESPAGAVVDQPQLLGARLHPREAAHLTPVARLDHRPLELPWIEAAFHGRQDLLPAHREQPPAEPPRRLRRIHTVHPEIDGVALEATRGDATGLPPISDRLPQRARHLRLEPLARPVGERTHLDLAAKPVGPQHLADRHEGCSRHLIRYALTAPAAFRARASRVFTVLEGWAPLSIQAWALSISILMVGGSVSGL